MKIDTEKTVTVRIELTGDEIRQMNGIVYAAREWCRQNDALQWGIYRQLHEALERAAL